MFVGWVSGRPGCSRSANPADGVLHGSAFGQNVCSVVRVWERLFGVKDVFGRTRPNTCLTTRANIRTLPGMTESHTSGSSLTDRQRSILECIETSMAERGFPPSVREIGDTVGLTSPSTVHNHLNTLQKLGYLERDPNLPRAIKVCWDRNSGAIMNRGRVHHVPLVGDVAAGTDVLAQQNVEELLPLPADFTGDGDLFMLRVRGESMIDAGILDGDYVVARQQPSADNGDIVVAGIPGEEATVKTFTRRGSSVVLTPANAALSPMTFSADDVRIFGKVVTVLRRL